MVVLLRDDKVLARALLVNLGDMRFLDRIYYTKEQDIRYLKNWAKTQGIYSRVTAGYGAENMVETPDGGQIEMNLSFRVKNFKFETYPYVDTFKFINLKNGTIYNHMADRVTHTLTSTGGAKYTRRRFLGRDAVPHGAEGMPEEDFDMDTDD